MFIFYIFGYSDADLDSCKVDKKSTLGMCQLMGYILVSWYSKKQNIIALSSKEAKYVALENCCAICPKK